MAYDDVVKEFIDFVNLQVGVYMNSIAGFSGTKMQMERQVARVLRAQSRKQDARGDQVIEINLNLEELSTAYISRFGFLVL